MMIRAVFFDLSGVLFIGTQAIAGAVTAINSIQQSGLQIRFVTNTSRMTRWQIHHSLSELGFNIERAQIFSAPQAAKAYIKQHNLRPYCLLHKNIVTDFDDINQQQANAVLVGDAEHDFSYQNLNLAFQLCQAGAPLIGIGDNRYFKLDGQLQLDAGPFIHLLAYAAGCQATIIGKPSSEFFHQVSQSCSCPPEQIMMIGDDVYGDIEGALNAGMQACLVKTGKYQRDDEKQLKRKFYCVESVVEAVALIMSGR